MHYSPRNSSSYERRRAEIVAIEEEMRHGGPRCESEAEKAPNENATKSMQVIGPADGAVAWQLGDGSRPRDQSAVPSARAGPKPLAVGTT